MGPLARCLPLAFIVLEVSLLFVRRSAFGQKMAVEVLNLPYFFAGTKDNLRQALSGKAVSMMMSKNWVSDIMSMQHGNPVAFLQDRGLLSKMSTAVVPQ